jgi:hypothetical protein
VRLVELAIAAAFSAAGLRSLWIWSRRRFEGTDMSDHVLYALFVTGRVGLWFAFAGFFLIYASIDLRGRPGLDEVEPYRWYLVVPLVLGAMQLLAGWFLGRRPPTRAQPRD